MTGATYPSESKEKDRGVIDFVGISPRAAELWKTPVLVKCEDFPTG